MLNRFSRFFAVFVTVLPACLFSLSVSAYEHRNSASLNFGVDMTAVTGSRSLIGVNEAFIGLSDFAFEKFPGDFPKLANIFLRLGSFAAVDLPIQYMSMLIQHEFFGHGSRYREFGGEPHFIYRAAPWPFGSGIASATSDLPMSARDFNLTNVGGVTALDVMTADIGKRWVENNEINGRMGWLYLVSSTQTSGYVWVGKSLLGRSGDIGNYQNNTGVSEDTLFWMSFINLADPLLYESLYAMYNYIAHGEKTPLWMIPISDNIHYLPSFRMTFTPFGPDVQMHNYGVIYDRAFDLSVRYGQLNSKAYWGIGFEGQVWQFDNLTLGTHLEIWQQPFYAYEFSANPNLHAYGDPEFGGMGTIKLSWRFMQAVSIDAEAGGKSRGWVQGELFGTSGIFRAGTTIFF